MPGSNTFKELLDQKEVISGAHIVQIINSPQSTCELCSQWLTNTIPCVSHSWMKIVASVLKVCK